MEFATRAAYRGQLTKIVKAVSDYLSSSESQLDREENLDAVEEELRTYIQRLRAVKDSLTTVNTRIIENDLIKADFDQEMAKTAEYEDTAIAALSRLEARLKKLTEKFRLTPTNIETEKPPRPQQCHVSLPKLTLKKFDGNVKDWLPFWEQFRLSVHENASLSGTEKFGYLESCLLGAARKVITGFTASENCYDAAISLLQEQYGDVERLIDSHIQQLVSLRPVHSATDVNGLRNLYNATTTCRRSLTALNVASNQYDVMLKSILFRCLPAELRINYHRMKERERSHQSIKDENEDEPNTTHSHSSTISAIGHVHNLMEFLKYEIEAMERSKLTVSLPQNHHKVSTASTAASLVALKENEECVFCHSTSHHTKECDANLTIVQKRDLLSKNGRCFKCARKGHVSRKCRSVKWIKCCKCKGNHMTTMCDPKVHKVYPLAVMQPEGDREQDRDKHAGVSSNLMCNSRGEYTNVFLKTARCIGKGMRQKDSLLLRIVIDGGSQNTFICENVVKKLNLTKVGEVRMAVLPFGSTTHLPQKTIEKVKICLKSQFDQRAIEIEALVVPQICIDRLDAPNEKCLPLSNFRLADKIVAENIKIEPGLSLLIGADYYWEVVSGNQRKITKRLRAVETLFGWTVQGLHEHTNYRVAESGAAFFVSKIPWGEESCEERLATMWALESIGIQGEKQEKGSLTEKLTRQCIRQVGSRYQASLPWKDDSSSFCGDRKQAIARVDSLVRRLSRDPTKLAEYNTAIQNLLKEGIAESVNDRTSKRTFYLPHHPIYKAESETTRLRIVFDASFHTEDHPSLNSCLVTGTNLLADVQAILLNFRMGPFALVADIEKAFLQILLAEEDRDSHRFVWLSSIKDRHYQDYRMTRVTFGVNCSPFLLSATIQHHLRKNEEKYPGTCKSLMKSFYMDDLVLSFNTEVEGQNIYRDSMEIMKAASMSLRKWHSNSSKLRTLFGDQEMRSSQGVLGLIWHVYTDELQVSLRSLQGIRLDAGRGSKRTVLQAIARIYDPLGIVSPTVIRLKIFFQAIWKRKLGWDEPIPSDLLSEWHEVTTGVLQLANMTIPRTVLPMLRTNIITIHVFAEAGLKAYGAVAYVKSVSYQGEINVSFLCAKSRVAPLKESKEGELTLPKLELTANLIAARLSAYLKKTLKVSIHRCFLWSDSKIALNWIYGETNRWKPYVQSRVVEIRSLTRLADWGHCCGKENPADLVTRGILGDKLKESSIWLRGPEWLKEHDDQNQYSHTDGDDISSPTVLLSEVEQVVHKINDPVLDCENFSTWTRLLRTTAWIQRFLRVCQKRTKASVQLTAEELDLAENYWVRYVQYDAFANEIRLLQKGQPIPGKSPIYELCPFLDAEGYLRLGGRQQLLDDTFDVRHPKILPADSRNTKLLIEDCHVRTLHGGASIILAKLREKFWVLRGRQFVKKLLKKCFTCKKLFGKVATQPFAPLPKERITLTRPFDNVGGDFAGPMFYTTDVDEVMHKSYVMIITCAAIRAVHLELVPNMTTEGCLMALRRFIARRGVPSLIISDNAKTFRRAAQELNDVPDSTNDGALRDFLCQKRIRWQFIVERAPWWGGFWERLIRTIKTTLKAVIGSAKLSFEQLRTLLTEAEAIVNDRPITYVSSDPLDLAPLSPSKFLSIPTIGGKEGNISTNSDIQELWKHRFKYANKLWRRWRVEYLQTLRLFHTNIPKCSPPLREGDVILLFDHAKPRVHWKLAIIEKAFPGRDGRVRSCEIRCGDGKVFRRPVQLLYPLEIGPAEDVEN